MVYPADVHVLTAYSSLKTNSNFPTVNTIVCIVCEHEARWVTLNDHLYQLLLRSGKTILDIVVFFTVWMIRMKKSMAWRLSMHVNDVPEPPVCLSGIKGRRSMLDGWWVNNHHIPVLIANLTYAVCLYVVTEVTWVSLWRNMAFWSSI